MLHFSVYSEKFAKKIIFFKKQFPHNGDVACIKFVGTYSTMVPISG